eukprot:9070778-Prorocentrum_lima.AAC.1
MVLIMVVFVVILVVVFIVIIAFLFSIIFVLCHVGVVGLCLARFSVLLCCMAVVVVIGRGINRGCG